MANSKQSRKPADQLPHLSHMRLHEEREIQPRIMELDMKKIKSLMWGHRAEIATWFGLTPTTFSSKLNGSLPFKLSDINMLAIALTRLHGRSIHTLELIKETIPDPRLYGDFISGTRKTENDEDEDSD